MSFVLLFPPLVPALYICVRGVFTLSASLWLRFFLSALVFAVAFKYAFYASFGGSLAEPSVSGASFLLWEALFGALTVFAALLLVRDVALVALFAAAKAGASSEEVLAALKSPKTVSIAAVLSLVLGFYGLWSAIRIPEVRRVTVLLKNLPPAWDGTRIVQLSDLHIGPVQKKAWLSEIVSLTNALDPDLVLITGDFVDGSVAKLREEMTPLADLKSRYGVYAVPGNHEYYSGYKPWMRELSSLGITMLENRSVTLQKKGAELIIGGTTDFGAGRFSQEVPNLKKTFEGTDPSGYRILLTHQPKTASQSTERFDFQLSGHTHGGQIFFLYPLVSWFNDGLVGGPYKRGDRTIYVHRGSGVWNGFSMRLAIPSEITEMTLKRAP